LKQNNKIITIVFSLVVCFSIGEKSHGDDETRSLINRVTKGISDARGKSKKISYRANIFFKHESFLERNKDRSLREEYKLRKEEADGVDYFYKDGMAKEIKVAEGLQVVNCTNSRYSFGLSKNSKGGKYALTWLTPNDRSLGRLTANERAVIEQELSHALDIILPMYYLQGYYIWDIVEHPSFEVSRISSMDYLDSEMYKMEYSCDMGNDGNEQDYYCIIDPDNSWIVREHGIYRPDGEPGRVWNKTEVRIVKNSQGGIIPESFVISDYLPSNGTMKLSSKRSFTYTINDTDVTKKEFYLSHYGLPEPNFDEPFLSTWMKYLLAGLVCLGIAYWIKRRRAVA